MFWPHVETQITPLIDDQAVYSPQIVVDLSGNKLTLFALNQKCREGELI